MKKKILYSLGAILLLIQFYRPQKNNFTGNPTVDITYSGSAPANVISVLKKACYDCHSNKTLYPWYAQIQPISSWLNNHIVEGKEELNFSIFEQYSVKKKIKKLNEIAEEIYEKRMPLKSYTILHSNAILTDNESQLVVNWAYDLARKLEKDSLQRF